MDLKQLEYFVTVINEGTISSAARKLNLPAAIKCTNEIS